MRIPIGSILPGQRVELTLLYNTQLITVYQGYWEFEIPFIFTPMLISPNSSKSQDPSTPVTSFTTDKPYTWDISIRVEWQGGLARVGSPSHSTEIVISQVGQDAVLIKLDPNQKHLPEKPFRLLIQDKNQHGDTVIVSKSLKAPGLPRFAAMLQFMPQLSQLSDITEQIQEDMKATRGEFIFILDRSVSMNNKRIVQAKSALVYFLKSLPPNDSYLHVISFGSSFYPMPKSIKYDNLQVDQLIKQITAYNADMGGTEILQPVRHAFNLPSIENHQRLIFLLTDGEVGNETPILEFIEKTCSTQKARIFTIGVGSSCSKSLIIKAAEAGRGKYVFISDEETNMESLIVQLLREAFVASLSDIQIQFDPEFIRGLSPQPNTTDQILRNEPFRAILLVDQALKDKTTWVNVSYFDAVKQSRVEHSFPVSIDRARKRNLFHRIFLKSVLEGRSSYFDRNDTSQDREQVLTAASAALKVWDQNYTSVVYVSSQKTKTKRKKQAKKSPKTKKPDQEHTPETPVETPADQPDQTQTPDPTKEPQTTQPARTVILPTILPRDLKSNKHLEKPKTSNSLQDGRAQRQRFESSYFEAAFSAAASSQNNSSVFLNSSNTHDPSPSASHHPSSQRVASEQVSAETLQAVSSQKKSLISLVSISGEWQQLDKVLQLTGAAKSSAELKLLYGIEQDNLLATALSYLFIRKHKEDSETLILSKASDFLKSNGIDLEVLGCLSDSESPADRAQCHSATCHRMLAEKDSLIKDLELQLALARQEAKKLREKPSKEHNTQKLKQKFRRKTHHRIFHKSVLAKESRRTIYKLERHLSQFKHQFANLSQLVQVKLMDFLEKAIEVVTVTQLELHHTQLKTHKIQQNCLFGKTSYEVGCDDALANEAMKKKNEEIQARIEETASFIKKNSKFIDLVINPKNSCQMNLNFLKPDAPATST